MISHPTRLLLSVLAFAVGIAATSSADAAKARKHKRVAAPSAHATPGAPASSGTTVYVGGLYMGSDPDANIRSWFYKDLSGRWGGSY